MKSIPELNQLAETHGGMPVFGVLAESPAAKAGLQYGDIVLSINGEPVRDGVSYSAAMAGAPEEFSMVIVRDDETLTLQVKRRTSPSENDDLE